MIRTLLLAATATLALGAGVNAQTAAVLTGNGDLVHVDLKALKAVKTVTVSGIPGKITGIDVRPADGMLYALVEDGSVFTVDPATGKAMMKAKLETMLGKGIEGVVDFNPVADRMRIIGTDGTSLRANVDDGKVAVDGKIKFKEGDPNAAKMAKVVAGAYSNSVKGTKETNLYDIDTSGAYSRQAPPNDGILNTLGTTGLTGAAAFDISTDAAGMNTGWVIAGKTLYSIDIATGATTKKGMISGLNADARDVAVLMN